MKKRKRSDPKISPGSSLARVMFRQVRSSTNSCRLWPILDELWTQVRRLLWSPAGVQTTLAIRQSALNHLTGKVSATTNMSSEEEEAIAVKFINKVRSEIHGLPGDVMPRKFLFPSIER